jgi:hypothetical protein
MTKQFAGHQWSEEAYDLFSVDYMGPEVFMHVERAMPRDYFNFIADNGSTAHKNPGVQLYRPIGQLPNRRSDCIFH